MKLAQTLAGNWVITVANTEEEGWETQLAEFDISATGEGSKARAVLEAAAAAAFVQLARAFTSEHSPASIQSHSSDAVSRMRAACIDLGFTAV